VTRPSELAVTINKTGSKEFEGNTYPNTADSRYLAALQAALPDNPVAFLLKIPEDTGKSDFTPCVAAFQKLQVKHLSIIYY